MGFQAFNTIEATLIGQQPKTSLNGVTVTLDGRLDNRVDLNAELNLDHQAPSDADTVLAAFERWGEDFASHLVGEWALALWSESNQALYLARDHAGTRNLFWQDLDGTVTWSSCLETFFVHELHPRLDENFVAQFLGSGMTIDRTPYYGVLPVLPAHMLIIKKHSAISMPHWHWITDKRIEYGSDMEYEERLRNLFRMSVERRIGPGAEILAELSGGVDSSSIVCMADSIRRSDQNHKGLVDTVSYYSDLEPSWDERPYFSRVEEYRRKVGVHIDVSSFDSVFQPASLTHGIPLLPGLDRNTVEMESVFESAVGPKRGRVILSGIGGDELLGGVPTALPELADLLTSGRVIRTIARSIEWCIVSNTPLVRLLSEAVRFTVNLYFPSRNSQDENPPWLSPRLRRLLKHPWTYPAGRSPHEAASASAINSGRAWWQIVASLPHLAPRVFGPYEYRYPFLDRDLVDFLHAIPREQLVRPGRRRSLMRRAFKGILPEEILERKRKAYVSRGPLLALRAASEHIVSMFSDPLAAQYGFVDPKMILATFQNALAGESQWTMSLVKMIGFELWLRDIHHATSVLHNGESRQNASPALVV